MEGKTSTGSRGLASYQNRFLDDLLGRLDLRGLTLLEIGSAGGALARALAEAGAARVVGIDLEPAGQETRKPGTMTPGADRPRGEVDLVQMDAHRLSFEEGSFDAAVSVATLEHVADPAAVLAEIHRVLKPGGFFLARFAPIWTFATGHHYQVWLREPEVHIPVWAHLYWDDKAMFDFLAERHGAAPAGRAVEYIYRSRKINRVPCRAYLDLFHQSPFAAVEATPLVNEGFRPYLERTHGRLPGYSPDELLVAGFAIALRKGV